MPKPVKRFQPSRLELEIRCTKIYSTFNLLPDPFHHPACNRKSCVPRTVRRNQLVFKRLHCKLLWYVSCLKKKDSTISENRRATYMRLFSSFCNMYTTVSTKYPFKRFKRLHPRDWVLRLNTQKGTPLSTCYLIPFIILHVIERVA